MIEIIYRPEQYMVTIRGHARSAEKGEDLVCAAVSALVNTLRCNAFQLEKAGAARIDSFRLAEGVAELRLAPRARYRHIVRMVQDAVCLGFDFLGSEYPDYVHFEKR